MFCNILIIWGSTRYFCQGKEDDEPHWVVRCQVCRILLARFASMVWSMASESMVLGLTDLADCKVLATRGEFLEPTGYCTMSSSFVQQMFLAASVELWSSLNS